MMKKEQIKELLKPYMESIGFTEVVYSEDNNSLKFKRKSQGGFIQQINIVSIPVAWYVSDEVNKHLSHIIDVSYNNNYQTIKNHYVKEKVLQAEADVFRDLPFKTKADKEAYLARLQQHIEQYVLPFFELYPDLRTFHDTVLDKIPFEDMADYIPGECNLKAFIIFKMFSNPKYQEYVDFILDMSHKGIVEDPDWKHFYEKSIATYTKAIEYLESDEFKAVQNK